MSTNEIFIESSPFEEILRSTSEVLPKNILRRKECLVYLFGETSQKKDNFLWKIETAHAVQIIDRYPQSVGYKNHKDSERAKFSLKNNLLGDYHAHVPSIVQKDGKKIIENGLTRLSKFDREQLKKDPLFINLVAGLKEIKIRRKLKSDPHCLSGYLSVEGKDYKIGIKGYYFENRARCTIIKAPKSILKLIQ